MKKVKKTVKIATSNYQHPLLLMAPRRPTQQRENLTSGLSDLFLADHSADSAFESAFESSNSDSSMAENHRLQRCCVPQGDCLKNNTLEFGLINLDDLTDTVRIVCSNDGCNVGQYMHRECFDQWEQGVISYLKSIGRARSWSDKQRQQNLWNKKGYDLVYKACGCRCGRGHIKKNLDWTPPATSLFGGSRIEEESKKKKRRNRNNQKPILSTVATSPNAYHPNQQMMKISSNSIVDNMMHNLLDNSALTVSTPQTTLRGRAGSLSSSTGSSSPPFSTSEQSISPVHNTVMNKQKQKEQTEIYSDRVRWVLETDKFATIILKSFKKILQTLKKLPIKSNSIHSNTFPLKATEKTHSTIFRLSYNERKFSSFLGRVPSVRPWSAPATRFSVISLLGAKLTKQIKHFASLQPFRSFTGTKKVYSTSFKDLRSLRKYFLRQKYGISEKVNEINFLSTPIVQSFSEFLEFSEHFTIFCELAVVFYISLLT